MPSQTAMMEATLQVNPRDRAVGEDGAALPTALAPEPADPARHEPAPAEVATGDHDGSPSGTVSVEVEQPISPRSMGATGTSRGPRVVDVGQGREHLAIELDTSHTPQRVEGVDFGRQTSGPRRVLVSAGVIPGGASLPGHAACGVRLPIAASRVAAERGLRPTGHGRLQLVQGELPFPRMFGGAAVMWVRGRLLTALGEPTQNSGPLPCWGSSLHGS